MQRPLFSDSAGNIVSLTRGISGSRKTKRLLKWSKWEMVVFWTKMMAVETEGDLSCRRMDRICWWSTRGEWRREKLRISITEADCSESMWFSSKHFSWCVYCPTVTYHLFNGEDLLLTPSIALAYTAWCRRYNSCQLVSFLATWEVF